MLDERTIFQFPLLLLVFIAKLAYKTVTYTTNSNHLQLESTRSCPRHSCQWPPLQRVRIRFCRQTDWKCTVNENARLPYTRQPVAQVRPTTVDCPAQTFYQCSLFRTSDVCHQRPCARTFFCLWPFASRSNWSCLLLCKRSHSIQHARLPNVVLPFIY